MKKILTACSLIALLLGFSPTVMAGGNTKVNVCHVNSANDSVHHGHHVFGKFIRVSENSVDFHLAHGDSTDFLEGDTTDDLIEHHRADHGALLPNANCVFVLPPHSP